MTNIKTRNIEKIRDKGEFSRDVFLIHLVKILVCLNSDLKLESNSELKPGLNLDLKLH